MEIKKYLVFKEGFPVSPLSFSVYEWNEEKQWWLQENGYGHSLETVKKHGLGRAYNQFDTMEEANAFIAYQHHAKKHGPKEKEYTDFSCPKCGYQYEDMREDCDFTMEYEIKCLCGHIIKVTPRLVYDVE